MPLRAAIRLPLAVLAGLVLPLTLAPFDLWYLGPIVVAALMLLLQRAQGWRQGFMTGWAFGIGKYGLGVSWIFVSIHRYGHASIPLSVFLVALFVVGLALFNAVFAALYCLRKNGVALASAGALASASAFAGMWLLLDWVLTWAFTGFPWLVLGYGHLNSPLAGYAPLFGVAGVTAVVVLTGVALPLLLDARRLERRLRIVLAAVVVALWIGGAAARELRFAEPFATREVALVQGNIDQDTKWSPGTVAHTLNTYVDLSRPHFDVDILLWPEAAVTLLYEEAGPFLDQMAAATAAHGGALVTGIVSWREHEGIRNLTVVAGRGEGIYVKRRLVPFGEYVPLESWLRGVIGFFDLPMSHTEPGEAQQPLLRVGQARIAMAICYEVVYPELVRRQAEGANLLATVSNDTWFGGSIGPLQHLEMARMRALELARFMLRATNNGVTALIDDRGEVIAQLPQFEAAVLRGKVDLMTGTTPFARWGDGPVKLLCALLLLAGVVGAQRGRAAAA